MTIKQSLKSYIFSYNLIRSQQEEFGALASLFLLTVNTFQMISILTLIPSQRLDLFSLVLKDTIGLFALPNFIRALEIPFHIVLFALVILIGVYVIANLLYILLLRSEAQMRKYSWVIVPLPRGDVLYLYKKLMFVPIVQLALSEVLQISDSQLANQCTFQNCQHVTLGLGIVLLLLALFVYCSLTFISIPCTFEDESQEESASTALEVIKSLHISSIIGVTFANVNVFLVFGWWGTYLVIDLLEFLLIGKYTRQKLEYFYKILKGIEIAAFCMFVLSNAVKAYGLNYGFMGFIICSFSIKLIYNLKISTQNQITAELTSNLQGIDSLHPLRVHKCLKSLFHERNVKSTKNHERSSITWNALLLPNNDPRAAPEPSNLENKELFYENYLQHQDSLTQNIVDVIDKIYSLIDHDTKNKIRPNIRFLWVLFLKDVKKSHVKAYTLLSQMQKNSQQSSFRDSLQKELLDYLIRQQISSTAAENSVTAGALFTFIDDVQKAKQSIEQYLVKTFEFFILLQNQIVKDTDIKKQGGQLLSDRVTVLKQLNSLVARSSTHQETIELFSFFINDVIENDYEGKVWELMNKKNTNLINNANLKCEKDWNMTFEFLANSIDDSSSYHHVIIVSLDLENSGRVLKISNRLLQMLDFVGIASTSLQIDSLEGTFFNRKNMKWIKDQIMEGKNPFDAFLQKERVLYLKNKKGKFFAFHFIPRLEIYSGVPTIVCYLRTFHEFDHKFIIFNPDKQNKIIGVGGGLSWLEDQSFKNKRIEDFIPSFKNNCQELTHPVMVEGDSFNFNFKKQKKTSDTIKAKSPLFDEAANKEGFSIDYLLEMLHSKSLLRRFGVLTVLQSSKKELARTRIRLSEAREESPTISMRKQTQKSIWAKSGVSPGFTNFDSQEMLSFQSKERILSVAENEPQSPNMDFRSDAIKFTILSHSQARHENQNADSELSKPFQLQTQKIAGFESDEEEEAKKSQVPRTKLSEVDFIQGSNSESQKTVFNQRNKKRETTKKKPTDSPKQKHPTHYAGSSAASSIGARLNYLRNFITGDRTPAIITTIYAFGIIIFCMTIVCTIVVYSILIFQYQKLSDFASHATFTGFLNVVTAGLYEATEMQLGVNTGLIPDPLDYWGSSVYAIVDKKFDIFVSTYESNLVDFNPETLTPNLNLNNYTIDFGQLPELEINTVAGFYDTTAIFMGIAQKITLIPIYPNIFKPILVDFMRFFDQPYTSNALDPIRTMLVQSAYDQYDYVITLLNSIVIACSLLIAGLTFSFAFIFRKFENMETEAFAKLCTVLPKEHLPTEINKIIESYQMKVGSSSALSGYTKNALIWSSAKSKKSQNTSQSSRKTVQTQVSLQKIIGILVIVAFALSGSFLMTNIIFKAKTQVLLPYLEDLDKISNGIPSYTIVFAIFLRFINEIADPNLNETLPVLVARYQPIIADAIQAHEDMMPIFTDYTSRIMDTDITSSETKNRYQNISNASFCYDRDQNGTLTFLVELCLISLNNAPSEGLPSVAELIIQAIPELIQRFINNPTQQTVSSIMNSGDLWYFNYLASIITNVITWLVMSEQIDISLYAESLVQETSNLRIICLIYNCLVMLLIWIPTIIYLKRRTHLSRNIFLLYPMRLLNANASIRKFFKKW